MSGLPAFGKDKPITAGHFTGIGAVSEAEQGFFDDTKIPHDGQSVVLSLTGDVAATAKGGHLTEAPVWPKLEGVPTESPKHLRRTFRPELGLALVDLK